jgi:hypothetical protein
MANLLEGGRRISVAGQVALKVSCALAFLSLLVFALSFTDLSLHARFFSSLSVVMLLAVPAFWLAAAGATLLIVGWIVRGFATPPAPQAPSSRSAAELKA